MVHAKYKHYISCHKRACLLNRHFSGPKCARLREVRCIYLYSSLLSFAIFYLASMNQALSSEADNLSFFPVFLLVHRPPTLHLTAKLTTGNPPKSTTRRGNLVPRLSFNVLIMMIFSSYHHWPLLLQNYLWAYLLTIWGHWVTQHRLATLVH